jgi:hypothetical protein
MRIKIGCAEETSGRHDGPVRDLGRATGKCINAKTRLRENADVLREDAKKKTRLIC